MGLVTTFISMVNVLVLFSRSRVVTASSRHVSTAFVSSATRRHSSIRAPTQGIFGKLATTTPRYNTADYSRTLRFASTSADNDDDKNKKIKKGKPQSKKLKVKEITPQNIDKLAAAFDDLARKEGFDSSTSHLAEDATFEDFFDEDDAEDDVEFLDEDDEFLDDNESDGDTNLDDLLDSSNFDLSDFVEGQDEEQGEQAEGTFSREREVDEEDDDDDDDDEFLDFGGGDENDDMEARIAAAQKDMAGGRVSVPDELDKFAQKATDIDLKELGFKRELNPFGNDETPRREQFKLITKAMTCSACGSDFQSRTEEKPGYLPAEKFEVQTKLAKIEEMQQLKAKAESASEWSPEDEIEYLIQTADGTTNDSDDMADIDIDRKAQEMGLDLVELSKKNTICKRCHGLQNFGKVDAALRPGWTEEQSMSQEQFRDLLKPISQKPAVIIALVDLFDFSGSVLRELDGIAGDNPVLLAANKVDLLPATMGKQRAENWVRRELDYMGVKSLANMGGAVRLISCKTGLGVADMLDKARGLADEMDCDVYVVGAANAGKSTLINSILGKGSQRQVGKARAGNKNAFKGALTTSPLPGTTLKFIKIDLGDGRSMYDTPGLLVPGTITQLLTPEELKIVCPKKPVEPITFRVSTGKCVLVGGLARVEVIGDSKPFLLTFFVANDVKLHPTDSARADDFIKNHAGGMLTPPLEPTEERMAQLAELDTHIIDIEGAGWKEAAADISLTGLGWVAVTGAGSVKVKISVPKGIGISVRPPLMPFDMWEVAAKYTGSRAVRKSAKSKTGKRRKGVGRN